MKKGTIALIVVVVLLFIMFFSFKGYYNSFVTLEEQVSQSWAQVENVYQRRADLIPNLVEVVKGYAKHEQETLQGVVDARSKMGGQVNVSKDVLNDPQAFAKFQQMQGALSSALIKQGELWRRFWIGAFRWCCGFSSSAHPWICRSRP